MPTTTGWDLTVARVRANLSKTAVAARLRELGVRASRQTLWVHEKAATVDPDFARSYLQAVADLSDDNETPRSDAA